MLLYGSSVPLILRSSNIPNNLEDEPPRVASASGAWRLVGSAYVHGVMDGEVLRSLEPLMEQAFSLI